MNTTEMHCWPGWETVRLIGRGSFGAVYEIQREIRGRTEHAALKVISIPQNESEIYELRADGYDEESITQYFVDSLEKIEDEYAMMADLKGHSNVVYCDDIRTVQHDNGFGWDIYIKMELLTPLKNYLSDKVTDAQVIKLGMDICAALELCEDLNIVHRDIKPENVFVSRNGSYKLGDFGIAKTMEGTTGGTKTGTYDYMAPEVYNNRPYHTQADIYSLGLVMYWLLNNRIAPFLPQNGKKPTPTAKTIARDHRFSGETIPNPLQGSNELQRIVLKACAYDPKDRYQSAREMREDLMRLSGGQAAECIPEPKPAPIPDIQDDNKTVGPVFNHPPVIDADDWDKTVGPQFLSKDKKDIPDKKKNEQEQPTATFQKTHESHASSKKMGKILIGGICILIVLIIGCIYDNAFPQYVPIEPTSLIEQIPVDNVLIADEITFDKDSEGNYLTKPVFGSEIMRNQIKTITFLDSMKEAPETAWDVSELQNGAVMAWVESNGDLYDLYIAGDGGVRAPANCYGLFALYENIESLDFNGCFSTNQVSNMQSMFYNCKTLSALDVSNFDTSCVTSMVCMFRGCESVTDLDVSGFDTSNVTNMRAMFALCNDLKTLDVSGFNTSQVTNMAAMFEDCHYLTILDVSGFDTAQVTNMSYMFLDCGSLSYLDVSGFDISKVENYDYFMNSGQMINGQPWEDFFNNPWGLDMTLEEFEQCADLLIAKAYGWQTKELAPQTLNDFPFFPASIFDVFELVESADETVTFKDSIITWESELSEMLAGAFTGMEYDRSFRYVDGNTSAWKSWEFKTIGDHEFDVQIPDDVWEKNNRSFHLSVCGFRNLAGWNETFQVSYRIINRQLDGTDVSLTMSNDDYKIVWSYYVKEHQITIDISDHFGRIVAVTYDSESGKILKVLKY